jgi:AAA domain
MSQPDYDPTYRGDEYMAGLLDQALGQAADRSTEGSERFKRWPMSELLEADLTFQWDAVGMMVRPTYGMDTGELKSMKSYVGTSRAIGLAAGVPILGHWHVPERRRVLFYVAEGGRVPFTRRLIRLCEAHGVDPADLEGWLEPIFDAGPLDSIEFRDSLRGHLADYQPAFVHLDPLYPFQPASVDAHRMNQVGLMLNEVQAICAESDATFWITAHMNQSGAGFDLKRISGAGIGEWGDSWLLLKHRETPDVAGGRFKLTADIGSRQWGGASYDIDLNIGSFDADNGTHDGPITFQVRRGGSTDETRADVETQRRLKARRAVFTTTRKSRRPLTRTEIEERSTGSSKAHIRAEIAVMIDEGLLLPKGTRKPERGGKEAPMYLLAEGVDVA